MKLYFSAASPFVRKVMIVAHEGGIADRIELASTSTSDPNSTLHSDNPVSKVPALVTDSGEALYDSPVICEYLDEMSGNTRLIPPPGIDRWRALRQQALADAIMDALLARRAEARRPEALRWPEWDTRQANVVRRSLDALEAEAGSFANEFTIGHVTIACALSYLDFRFPDEDWRAGRERLARWYEEVSKRPSLAATPLGATG